MGEHWCISECSQGEVNHCRVWFVGTRKGKKKIVASSSRPEQAPGRNEKRKKKKGSEPVRRPSTPAPSARHEGKTAEGDEIIKRPLYSRAVKDEAVPLARDARATRVSSL
ncbi:uncharacterized protein LY79DRAFT_50814 [Colletotrichum navitas]|uniref:Uncharacterized protein n=1 Tax=Colletotrichum navitas TaxID=681940 RepID=A0AAD8V9M6_9PEZI|nr:uncharacterized protein LY79DRAFT_50814 [Colletotrichum navitas]KAK1596675.1 hypothetical protein LY79DRAFT_50814 [Colletotrichum navitas]